MPETEISSAREESKIIIEHILHMMLEELGDDSREEATIYLPQQVDMGILFHDYSIMFTKKYDRPSVEIDFCRMSLDGKPDFASIQPALGPHTLKIARALRHVASYLQDQGLTVEGKASEKRNKVYTKLAQILGIKSVALTRIR